MEGTGGTASPAAEDAAAEAEAEAAVAAAPASAGASSSHSSLTAGSSPVNASKKVMQHPYSSADASVVSTKLPYVAGGGPCDDCTSSMPFGQQN